MKPDDICNLCKFMTGFQWQFFGMFSENWTSQDFRDYAGHVDT